LITICRRYRCAAAAAAAEDDADGDDVHRLWIMPHFRMQLRRRGLTFPRTALAADQFNCIYLRTAGISYT